MSSQLLCYCTQSAYFFLSRRWHCNVLPACSCSFSQWKFCVNCFCLFVFSIVFLVGYDLVLLISLFSVIIFFALKNRRNVMCSNVGFKALDIFYLTFSFINILHCILTYCRRIFCANFSNHHSRITCSCLFIRYLYFNVL